MKKWTPKQITNLRRSMRLTQESFGKMVGVTRNYIHYLEKGVKTPSKTLRLLLDFIEKENNKRRHK
jgi:DNA-binding transcriptional regulator YiaG